MDSKKVIGGLMLGIVSVIVLGIILTFVVLDNGSVEDTTENTTGETQTVETEESTTEESSSFIEDITEATETEAVTETEPISETQQETAVITSCYGIWKPSKVEDGLTGEEISFNEAFGNDFYEIENGLTLSEDGSFELVLGTMKSEEEGHGTFTINDDSLEVTYANGKSDIFNLHKDIDGNINYVLVPKYNFTVYFERA